MSYKKSLIGKGWYTATIRQVRKENEQLVIVWTIDRGEYVYRNILERYDLTDEGIADLENKMNEIDYIIYKDYEDDFFFEQFVSQDIRASLHIDRAVVGKNIKNVVLERKLPTKPRDYNVKKRKDERFYHKDNEGKSLPIKKESEKNN